MGAINLEPLLLQTGSSSLPQFTKTPLLLINNNTFSNYLTIYQKSILVWASVLINDNFLGEKEEKNVPCNNLKYKSKTPFITFWVVSLDLKNICEQILFWQFRISFASFYPCIIPFNLQYTQILKLTKDTESESFFVSLRIWKFWSSIAFKSL